MLSRAVSLVLLSDEEAILSLSRALGGKITAVSTCPEGAAVPFPPYSTLSRAGPGSRDVA